MTAAINITAAIIIGWFVCGIAGMHLGLALDKAKGEKFTCPGLVWLVMFGPVLLVLTACETIDTATRKAPE